MLFGIRVNDKVIRKDYVSIIRTLRWLKYLNKNIIILHACEAIKKVVFNGKQDRFQQPNLAMSGRFDPQGFYL